MWSSHRQAGIDLTWLGRFLITIISFFFCLCGTWSRAAAEADEIITASRSAQLAELFGPAAVRETHSGGPSGTTTILG